MTDLISFPLGKGHARLKTSILSSYKMITPGRIQATESEEAIINKALEFPVGTPSLSVLLDKKRPEKVCVILPDVTRVAGVGVYLPLLVRLFKEHKIPPEGVSYIVGCGIHPPCGHEQLVSMLGQGDPDIAPLKIVSKPYKYRLKNGSALIQHNARDKRGLKKAGLFSNGAPLMINGPALDSDFLILTGAITFHYLAGFGGGRKAVLPGIAAYENCMDLHRLSLYKRWNRKNPHASLGNLKGNPLHRLMEEAAFMVRPTFILNTVCDNRKRIVHAVAGHWQSAFLKGIRFVRKNLRVESDTLFDAAIVSCGGFPKDINLIQAHKAFENNIGLIREGGAILLVGECSEGIGNPDLMDWTHFDNEADFVKALKADFAINGQTALSMFLKCGKLRAYMLTSIGAETLKRLNIRKVSKIEEFVRLEKLGRKKVALVPQTA